jgi:protein-L-isoaspartate(D-aspartate) O-methyltransferase
MDREALLAELRRDGIRDERVLAAMAAVPRDRFVPGELRREAWANHPLPIGHAQTISQPYVVAFMTEAARLRDDSRVLEVGTGSGYQTAVLAEALGLKEGRLSKARLASIEIVKPLADRARAILDELGCRVELRVGDGSLGWPELAPFDAILVTAAPERVPQALVSQLALGGRLVIPVGVGDQDLRVVTKTEAGSAEQSLLPVRFVPLLGGPPGG